MLAPLILLAITLAACYGGFTLLRRWHENRVPHPHSHFGDRGVVVHIHEGGRHFHTHEES